MNIDHNAVLPEFEYDGENFMEEEGAVIPSRLELARDSWVASAKREERQGDYAKAQGRYAKVHYDRHDLYMRAAKALELQMATGEEHCACHLLPASARCNLK
jgi:hypothetical protein